MARDHLILAAVIALALLLAAVDLTRDERIVRERAMPTASHDEARVAPVRSAP
jgi:hypothetical protein